jgi:hypothetical protein
MGLNRFSLPAVAVIMMINAMLLSQGCLEEERIALLQIKTSFGLNDIPSQLSYWGKDAIRIISIPELLNIPSQLPLA